MNNIATCGRDPAQGAVEALAGVIDVELENQRAAAAAVRSQAGDVAQVDPMDRAFGDGVLKGPR